MIAYLLFFTATGGNLAVDFSVIAASAKVLAERSTKLKTQSIIDVQACEN